LGHQRRRGIAAFNGVAINLDCGPEKIDNPDLGGAELGVKGKFRLPVVVERAVRDFDDDERVGRPGMGAA
jgi:hypothetical protein